MVIERVAEDPAREPAPESPESVSIVRRRSAAPMTSDVTIVVIALIATAFAVAVAVLLTELLPVLRARKRPKRNGDERRPA
jgi:hypothetical protein